MAALLDHALLSLQELKAYVNAGSGSEQDDNLRRAINAATGLVETRLRRQVVTRLNADGSPKAIIEYHTPGCDQTDLYLGEWPLLSIVTVHESDTTPRVYDGTTILTTADYETVKSRSLLRRVDSGLPQLWECGNRSVRVAYEAGYQDAYGTPAAADPIPDDIKQAAFFIAASVWKESDRRGWGVSSVSDATGQVTRFMGYVPPSIDEMLSPYKRMDFGQTWERVDEEAEYLMRIEVNIGTAGAPNLITEAESGTLFINDGAVAETYNNLPPASQGLRYGFRVTSAFAQRIVAAAGDVIRLGASVTAAGGYLRAPGLGSEIWLKGLDATTWGAEAPVGSWGQ